MRHNRPNLCGWFCLLLLAVSGLGFFSAGATAQETPEAETAVLLITEVVYDPPGLDEEREWVEIGNIGNAANSLDAYGLGDEEQAGGGEGMLRFPPGAQLDPGAALVVAQSARGFRALYGRNPDFEISDSDAAVPDMVPDPAWAGGRFALANDGDEVLLLDAANHLLDALSYGDKQTFMQPSIPSTVGGQSLARSPSNCDTDGAGDWQAARLPTPGELGSDGDCAVTATEDAAVSGQLPIGAIQGSGAVSPFLNQLVTFRGQVTGFMEDINSEGIIYYTLFVQDLPGREDGDPATSDGIAVFLGRQRPSFEPGDSVVVHGQVTEYYGLTEIDDRGLILFSEQQIEAPVPTETLQLPHSGQERALYLEAREGMLVSSPLAAAVLGPTHVGCGFALAAYEGQSRPMAHDPQPFPPEAILVQNASDVDCADVPQVKTGDVASLVSGPLTYHFEQYKIVLQRATEVKVQTGPWPPLAAPQPLEEGQYRVATLNLEDYLAAAEAADAERPSTVELEHKRQKLAAQIAGVLDCPTLLAVQEVESRALLDDLALLLAAPCGFSYQISHLDSVDSRGIDVALLSDPRRVAVTHMTLRQVCTPLATDVIDPSLKCSSETYPLFSRPPLEVGLVVENQPLIVWVTHLKSKRGGEMETAARRLAQADYVHDLAAEALHKEPGARLMLLGDINDTDQSLTWQRLQADGFLVNSLQSIPEAERYSYVYDGLGELIDGIFVSPALLAEVASADIVHVNADYPAGMADDLSTSGILYRASDHDAPSVVIGLAAEPTATITATRAQIAAPTAVAELAQAAEPTVQPATAENTANNRVVPGATFALLAAIVLGGLLLRRLRNPA